MSNRGSYAALGGCLIATILWSNAALGQIGNDVPGESPESPAEAAAKQENPPALPVLPPEPPEPVASPEVYEPDCDTPDSREEADLCAQRRMADAAEDTVKWVELQYRATIGEIIALIVTIGVAGIAVGAAFRANSISKESTQRQLRAYVFIKDCRRTRRGDTDPWVIETHLKNFGQTPAYRARIRSAVRIMGPADERTFDFAPPEKGGLQFDFAPGHDHTMRNEIPELVGGVWADFKAGRVNIYQWGRVDFIDAFGEPRWMSFRHVQPGGYVLNLFNCAQGNETSESQNL